MSLIVEDGTIVANAESYVSAATADAYFDGKQNAAWAALGDDDKEAALRKAIDYMQGAYRMRWQGYRMEALQALDWPRSYVPIPDSNLFGLVYVPQTTIPLEVKKAQMELALIATTNDLAPPLERNTLQETVGPLTTTYDPHSAEYTRYRGVDMLLSVYLMGSGAMAKLSRV